jgi:hypothetical protein
MIRVERYNRTRFWAVWRRGELVAVVVYRKGAENIARLLSGDPGEPKPEGGSDEV